MNILNQVGNVTQIDANTISYDPTQVQVQLVGSSAPIPGPGDSSQQQQQAASFMIQPSPSNGSSPVTVNASEDRITPH